MSSMFKKQQKEKKGWIEDSLLYMGCEKKMAPEMTTMIKCYFYSETKKYALLIFKQQEQKRWIGFSWKQVSGAICGQIFLVV